MCLVLEEIMEKIHDSQAVAAWVEKSRYRMELERWKPQLMLLRYEKGELVTSPMPEERLFQVVVQGSLNIYLIRDDGGCYSLHGKDGLSVRRYGAVPSQQEQHLHRGGSAAVVSWPLH